MVAREVYSQRAPRSEPRNGRISSRIYPCWEVLTLNAFRRCLPWNQVIAPTTCQECHSNLSVAALCQHRTAQCEKKKTLQLLKTGSVPTAESVGCRWRLLFRLQWVMASFGFQKVVTHAEQSHSLYHASILFGSHSVICRPECPRRCRGRARLWFFGGRWAF